MIHSMRQSDRQMPQEQCITLLNAGRYGTLALCGSDGMPYAVPVNYAYEDGHIYFHCAAQGHKLDILRENPNVSFCVVGVEKLVSEEFTTLYESVIAFGKASIPEERDAKLHGMLAICEKFSKPYVERLKCIKGDLKGVCVVDITVDRMTGKKKDTF